MAGKAVALRGVSVALACRTFEVSETCYRYSAKLNDENEQIADLLIGLTRAKKTWGFGLCFLYESGGAKLDHGSGGEVLLRAA